jgi:hypothetical protein
MLATEPFFTTLLEEIRAFERDIQLQVARQTLGYE